MSGSFEPKIIGFLCNWCSYAGADLAGISRLQYPPNLRIVRLMCSGRVDPIFVIHAFERGLDGVLVLGCHPGDCHYMTGNYQAERKVKALRILLPRIGVDPRRLRLDWVSAAEGGRFAEVVTEFTRTVKQVGPLGKAEGLSSQDLQRGLILGRRVFQEERLRWLVGREWQLTEQQNVYGEKVDQGEFDSLLERTIEELLTRHRILLELEGGERSVKELAESLSLSSDEVFAHITYLMDQGKVALSGTRGTSPLYSVAT